MILIVSGIILTLSIVSIWYYGFYNYTSNTTALTFSLIGLYLSFVGFFVLGPLYPIKEEVISLDKKEYILVKIQDGIILNIGNHIEKLTDVKTYNTPIDKLRVYNKKYYNSYNCVYKKFYIVERIE